MINNFLTYSHGKKEHKVHEELSIKPPQLAAFLDLLEIDLSAPAYENQQKKIVDLLISEIPDCNATDAEVFYYPASINVIQRSEEHTSELQSLMRISYAVFCLKKK